MYYNTKLESDIYEPKRVNSFHLFKRNLLDQNLAIQCCIIYLISIAITDRWIIPFIILFVIVDYHIESYKSFVNVRKSVQIIENNIRKHQEVRSCCSLAANHPTPTDSFNWLNKIIAFFWPFLSQSIHYQLNQFFRDQIESGSLGRSKSKMKRLLYAIIRQINTDLIVIERCQLGRQAPFVRALKAYLLSTLKESDLLGHQHADQTGIRNNLVYDIDFGYIGDMNISVIYRYLCCCASRIGLKDVFLNFGMRLTFGPITSELPFIERISITLLTLPDFGYKGIALAELAELKLVRRVINKIITQQLLYPQELSFKLEELLQPAKSESGSEDSETQRRRIRKEEISHEESSSDERPESVSCLNRCAARTLLCTFVCSNCCLKPCHQHKP